jgi:hypothetical protein
MGWQRTDDLDGSVPAEQRTFGLDGKAYTIDLGDAEFSRLQAALQRFLTVAVVYAELPAVPEFMPVVSPPRPPRPADPSSPPDANGKAPQRIVRIWANQNGYSVGPRGRIPEHIIAAYESEH